MSPLRLLLLFWMPFFVGLAVMGHAEERRSFLAADSSKGLIALIQEDGSTAWEYKIGPLHDLHYLPNGNILFQTNWTKVIEVEPSTNRVMWEYDAHSSPTDRVEIHAFERLSNQNTMLVESGRSRILEVSPVGKTLFELRLRVKQPDPHHDTRLVRKLASGNFLVCHEAEGLVREYKPSGETAWECEIPLFGRQPMTGHGVEAFGNQCFSALRLESGNTLISTGNGHSIIEVTPAKQIVWKLNHDDLPNIQLAWITTLQMLPSGNIVFGNCHAGPANPQIIEISRDKQVVWTFRDFNRFGNSLTNTQVLTVNGESIN